MNKQNKLKHEDETETEPVYKLGITGQKITSECGFLVFIKVLKAPAT